MSEEFNKTFANAIRTAAKAKNVSLKTYIENALGIVENTFYRWEKPDSAVEKTLRAVLRVAKDSNMPLFDIVKPLIKDEKGQAGIVYSIPEPGAAANEQTTEYNVKALFEHTSPEEEIYQSNKGCAHKLDVARTANYYLNVVLQKNEALIRSQEELLEDKRTIIGMMQGDVA